VCTHLAPAIASSVLRFGGTVLRRVVAFRRRRPQPAGGLEGVAGAAEAVVQSVHVAALHAVHLVPV
jgi:hypothetical protein